MGATKTNDNTKPQIEDRIFKRTLATIGADSKADRHHQQTKLISDDFVQFSFLEF